MELGIVIIYCTKKLFNANLGCQFFAYLTLESFFGFFSRFYLPTRKLPPILPFAISSLSGEDFSL
jgi:hypothetical protein